MTDQHQATPGRLQAPEEWSANTMPVDMVDTIREARSRIEALEKLHTAVMKLCERFNSEHQATTSSILHLAAETSRLGHRFEATQPPLPSAADRMLALQDRIRDGALSLADALKEIGGEPEPVQLFTAKYLFTAGNIQEDSFYYDQSGSNSVLFDIANLELGDGCLTPGDNIKIAHRWGEPPVSGVYSTINYKIASVSETENRAWTIRAVRVSSAPEPTVRTMLPSGLPVIPDPITRNPLKSDVHASFTSPQPSTLVDRVAIAINEPFDSDDEARAAIREVAAWLRSEYPQREGYGTAWASLLELESNR